MLTGFVGLLRSPEPDPDGCVEKQVTACSSSHRRFGNSPLFLQENREGLKCRPPFLLGSCLRVEVTLLDPCALSGCGNVHPRSPPL